MQPRAADEEVFDEVGDRVEHLFTVVDDEHDPSLTEALDNSLLCREADRVPDRSAIRRADRGRHGLVDGILVEHRAEIDEPPLDVQRVRLGHREREPRLARTARSDHRDEARPGARAAERVELAAPSDERRQWCRCRRDRAERRNRHRRGERGVVRQHGLLERAELGSGLEAELLGEQRSHLLVGAQRIALATAPVQGDDQLRVEALPERVPRDELRERVHHLRVVAPRQLGVDQALLDRDGQLLQSGRGISRESVVQEPFERVAGHQRAARTECLGRVVVLPGGSRLTADASQPLEPSGVDVVGREHEAISRAVADHGLGPDHAPQGRDLGLERVRRIPGRCVAPHLLDQAVARHGPRHREGQECDEALELGAGDGHEARRRPHVHRAEEDHPEERPRRVDHDQMFPRIRAHVSAASSARAHRQGMTTTTAPSPDRTLDRFPQARSAAPPPTPLPTTLPTPIAAFRRLAGPAAVVAGLAFVVAQSMMLPYDPKDHQATSQAVPFQVAGVIYLIGFCALVLVPFGALCWQLDRTGRFGVVATCAAVLGTMLLGGDLWFETFAVPWIADGPAPRILDGDPSILIGIGAVTSYVAFAVGWVLFGIAAYRARVFPRTISVAVSVGGAIGFSALLAPMGMPIGLAIAALGLWMVRTNRSERRMAMPV